MTFGTFNLQEFVSAFIIMFAVIDAIGATPIILSLRESGKVIKPMKATLLSTLLLVAFFYAGDVMLRLFHVDIASFAVAGSIVIFLMAINFATKIRNSPNGVNPQKWLFFAYKSIMPIIENI